MELRCHGSIRARVSFYPAGRIGTAECLPGLFLWPRSLGFPKSGFVASRRPLGIARPLAVFQRLNAQPPEMLTESVPNQCGAIAFCLPGRAVGRLQQFLIENDLDGFHLWS